MTAIRPLHQLVLCAENKSVDRTDAGIILDGVTSTRDSKTATVLAIGPEVTTVSIGDKVLLDWREAKVVKDGDAQRVMIKEEHIVAVIG
jgi:co-chaperonin GroES (HSP10)